MCTFSASLLELGHFVSPSSTPGLGFNICSPGSQAVRLRLNYTTDFSGSPPCRWQTVRFLSLHYNTSQFLTIKLYLCRLFLTHILLSKLLVLFLWVIHPSKSQSTCQHHPLIIVSHSVRRNL